jgi:hypothetical protein
MCNCRNKPEGSQTRANEGTAGPKNEEYPQLGIANLFYSFPDFETFWKNWHSSFKEGEG